MFLKYFVKSILNYLIKKYLIIIKVIEYIINLKDTVNPIDKFYQICELGNLILKSIDNYY